MKRARSTTSSQEGNKLHLLLQVIDNDTLKTNKPLSMPSQESTRHSKIRNIVTTPPGGQFDESRKTWDRHLVQSQSSAFISTFDAIKNVGSPKQFPEHEKNFMNLIPSLSAEQFRQLQSKEYSPTVTVTQGTIQHGTANRTTMPSSFSPLEVPLKSKRGMKDAACPKAQYINSPTKIENNKKTTAAVSRNSSCNNYNYRLEDYAVKFKAVFQAKADAVCNTPGAQIKKFQFIKEAYKEVVGREKDIRGGRKTKFDQMVEQCFHEVTCIPKRTLKRKKNSRRVPSQLVANNIPFQAMPENLIKQAVC